MFQKCNSWLDVARGFKAGLEAARYKLDMLRDGTRIEKFGESFGDLANDTEIKADRELGELFRGYFKCYPDIGRITIEGLGNFDSGDGEFWATIDPIDGSLNYQTRGATLGLPFSTCITLLNCRQEATFDAIVAAVVYDLRNGDLWCAGRTNNSIEATINNESSHVANFDRLDLGRMIVIGEMYYPENRERLARAFSGTKGWLRNPGSAAYEMALVSSGQAVAYVCDRQKQHELGAAYLLVRGAGGVAVDFEGHDLGPRRYEFNAQTPVVLAANQMIAAQILELLHKAD